jgi:hypothetical protein
MSATTRRGPRTTHAKSNKQSRPTIFWTGEPKDGDAGVDVAPSIGAPCSASARDGGLNADAEANDCGVVDWVAKTDCYSHGRVHRVEFRAAFRREELVPKRIPKA